MGALQQGPSPGGGAVIYINVESVDETLEKVKNYGGTLKPEQSVEAPKGAKMRQCSDTEGNVVGLLEGFS